VYTLRTLTGSKEEQAIQIKTAVEYSNMGILVPAKTISCGHRSSSRLGSKFSYNDKTSD
jgi:hypothetical protein